MADDFFDEMTEPDEPGGKKQTIGFAKRAPALNSVELCLLELMYVDPILSRVCTFEESDGTETIVPPDDPDIEATRPSVAEDYLRHIQLARSMGDGQQATWHRYRELCAENSMRPLHHSDADKRTGGRSHEAVERTPNMYLRIDLVER